MVNDIDLMLNTTILLHHWHLTTSSFKFRGCNIRNGHQQGATSGMGISKVQQQKWITTVQHNELNIDMVKNIKQKNNELHNIVYNKVRHQDMESISSTTSSIERYGTTSSIRRYGFNIVIYNIDMDKKNNHHLGNTTKDHISNKSTTEKIRLATIYGKNPTTTRRTTWMRYNNLTPTQGRSTSTS